jgi:hypothetical protein
MISKTLKWSAIPLMDFKKMILKIRWGYLSWSWRQEFFKNDIGDHYGLPRDN